jgi:phosphoserine aminotransferase
LAAIRRWVDASSIFGFLAEHPATISNTSVTLSIIDPWFVSLDAAQKAGFAAALAARLDAEGVGYDLGSYRDAPAGLRIWAGPMVDVRDVEALLPWIDWAYAAQRAEMS